MKKPLSIVESEKEGIYHVVDAEGTCLLCNVSYEIAEQFVKNNS